MDKIYWKMQANIVTYIFTEVVEECKESGEDFQEVIDSVSTTY